LIGTTRLLWLSRHYPTEKQQEELGRILGEYEIVHHKDPVNSVREVVNLIHSYGVDDVFVVLPQYMVEELVKLGVKPIKAQMQRFIDSNGTVHFMHDHFYRVHKMKVIREVL